MAKKYIIRTGFVVELAIVRIEQGKEVKSIRRYEEGEDITLEDADAALHLHKLEFALQKDREAALAAEKAAADAANPVLANQANTVKLLADAIALAMQAAAAPAPATA